MCAASFCETFHQSVVARALCSAVVWRLGSTSKADNMGSTNWSERLHMSLAVTWRHLCQWWTAGHWTNCSHHRQSFTPTSSDFRGLAALILQLTHPAPLPQGMSQDLILAILYPAVQKLIFLLQITPLLHKYCIYNIIVFVLYIITFFLLLLLFYCIFLVLLSMIIIFFFFFPRWFSMMFFEIKVKLKSDVVEVEVCCSDPYVAWTSSFNFVLYFLLLCDCVTFSTCVHWLPPSSK